MQTLAVRFKFNRLCVRLNLDTVQLHVPEKQLVAEGIDGASRDGVLLGVGNNVESVLGPSVSDELWQNVLGVAAELGWEISVDLFASAVNAPRAGCRMPFLQQDSVEKFVRKAMADGIYAIIVVAVAITEPYWHKLVLSSDCRPLTDMSEFAGRKISESY